MNRIAIRLPTDAAVYFVKNLFPLFTLHVSGSHKPIIRGISSCFLYTNIWFMWCLCCSSACACGLVCRGGFTVLVPWWFLIAIRTEDARYEQPKTHEPYISCGSSTCYTAPSLVFLQLQNVARLGAKISKMFFLTQAFKLIKVFCLRKVMYYVS